MQKKCIIEAGGTAMIYYAIIGDIKASKELSNRKETQDALNCVLKEVNTAYETEIAANFLITLGDEFQGLLKTAGHLLEIVKYIQRRMYPVKLRFGIGAGEISTKIDRAAAIGADGPAFYAAREMITEIRERENRYKKQAADIQMDCYGRAVFAVRAINTMLSLLKVIEDSWTEKQRYTIWDMMIHQGSQEMCAARMGTSQSTVARRLQDGKYVVYEHALDTVAEAMRKLEESV